METYCTRPDCSQPINDFPDLDERSKLQTAQQKYCNCCGMPQILAGRYIPQKLLGKGGFGAAYLALDRYTTQLRQCVVKQFQPSDTFNEKTLKIAEDLFTREAEVLETLGNEHPQIPDLYAFFPLILGEEGQEEKQFFYIVQEFIDGETLEQEVQKKGKLTEAEIIEVLENMLNILQFVHDHNSIHRDLKPSNLMRDQQGKLYLLDFGAVKRVTGANTSSRSTGIYSMGFAPPEQMRGRQVYPSTDLYALAATCLRLITGKPIQDLYDSYDNQWHWRKETDVSEELANILEKMLSPTPKHRFPSAQAALQALQENKLLDSDSEKITINQSSKEEAAFSQPADWRSLLSLNKEELEIEETPTQQKWQSLLSSSEQSKDSTTDVQSQSTSTETQQQETISPQETQLDDSLSAMESPSTETQEQEAISPQENQLDDSLSLTDSPSTENPESEINLPQENQPNDALSPMEYPNNQPEKKPPSYSPKPTAKSPRFALWEWLASAGFTGLEGALLLIAFTSVFNVPGISIGLWGMSMGGLIYAQWKRFIEKIDFLILGVLTLAVVVLVPPLHSMPVMTVIVSSIVASAGAIAFTALFRLILKILSR